MDDGTRMCAAYFGAEWQVLAAASWRRPNSCDAVSFSEGLRNRTRGTIQYGSLKHLYLSGTLVDDVDTSAWRVKTPNRSEPTFFSFVSGRVDTKI